MKKYAIKKAGKKGKGLFATKSIKKGEMILKVDLSKQKAYSRKDIDENLTLQSDHCDYVGRGKYVISFHPYSFMNHSCDPNVIVKHKSMAKSEFYAMRDIEKGEELTYDYGANALYAFDNPAWNKFKCSCKSKNCRKWIYSNFFKLPKSLQKRYWHGLPLSIRKRFKKLK
ncbi:SET domain-containing protein-lysine N-methyltransferase [Candidatus Woesearchaeota archaeon]|nr:SET domain-containing protein-lysine N-methyltransferase [Candidatus Woesearchaeota archaeon]MBW3005705.1 SET domain-containing protein-lysine N-methyltransferase [Candidatus Woesearchaeota archaeon]